MTTEPEAQVLFVDDDPATRRVVRLWFQTEGLDLEVAPTREAALDELQKWSPAVMVMDYLMPGLDAASFLERARQIGYSGPVLLCTGLDGDHGLPVDGTIRKPFDPEALVSAVRSVLSD